MDTVNADSISTAIVLTGMPVTDPVRSIMLVPGEGRVRRWPTPVAAGEYQ